MEDILIRFRVMNDEAQALRKLSSKELRKPGAQVHYILRCELERLGLLPPTPTKTEVTKNEPL